MSAWRPHAWLLGALLLGSLPALPGCALGTSIDEYPCPDAGTALTYQDFGQNFMTNYCQVCHGAPLGSRHGAPEAYDFATVDDVRQWRERIFARAAADNTSMPPGPDDPLPETRAALAEWLACGAP